MGDASSLRNFQHFRYGHTEFFKQFTCIYCGVPCINAIYSDWSSKQRVNVLFLAVYFIMSCVLFVYRMDWTTFSRMVEMHYRKPWNVLKNLVSKVIGCPKQQEKLVIQLSSKCARKFLNSFSCTNIAFCTCKTVQ